MTTRAWCNLHVTGFDATTGCKDCHALAAERLAADMQPVPVAVSADVDLEEPITLTFSWATMDGLLGSD